MNINFVKWIKSLPIVGVIILFGCSNFQTKHIGDWKSTTENTELILNNSNYAIFVINNRVSGGDDFILQGEKGELKYEIDYSKSPIWLDLIGLYKKNGQTFEIRLKGIVKFLTDRKIELTVNLDPDAPRPTGFDKGEVLILDKQN